ncbi:glucose-6-phosphate isomerase [Schnuerera sp. xch1]|uniref:glucose-6-phosphate isomerase n=1 Tax=Schnuerera sp. xch1 TaxID=2874283 RepID=UPI001CBBF29E|nr:glucose-6-phosphate isomerase [Schnuerera sp. xch1]MBZ2174601.1 glucose-6-phosphate isomerase [Schnuerera sp. xch1]
MGNITFDYSKSLIKNYEIEQMKPLVHTAHEMLHKNIGAGNEFTGWIDLPKDIDKNEIAQIKDVADYIRDSSDVLIIIGIGGSYLGARACIEALNHSFYNELTKDKRKGPEIYYVGNNISSSYILDLFDILEGKDISVNVISKSGTTTEPALAFRLFKEYIENRYGKEEAKKRIYVTTDRSKGALRDLTKKEGYTSFIIPDDIGGRYSVLTPVGLLPIAVSGIDIEGLLKGALDGVTEYLDKVDDNICYQYALIRNILYNKGKDIEIFVNYEPYIYYLAEWWKQLYGESEGKDGKGIYPASANFTTDLHSLGQFIQDGKRNLFETTINIMKAKKDLVIKKDKDNLDGLNFLAGKTIDYVNKKAFEGTLEAHITGKVPNLIINVPEMNEYFLGKLIYFFEKACAISGYILGVNPFDQPGVEEYKKNMFRLLGKPGY